MKNIQRIDEAVGSIEERRVSAEALLKSVVKGDSSEVEGIKLSKEMADSFLMWLQYSTYGKKFSALPFYKLFSASFNWGLDRYTKSAALKKEYKELKAKASEMRKAEKFESLKEAIDLLKSSWRGTKGWNDVARVMDAGLMKAIKAGSVSIGYAKDYVKSLERMAKRNAKKFFDEYSNFTEEDFIEDVEYNMANESVNEARFVKSYDTKVNDAETKKDVSKIYPKAKFFVGKLSHFFGELEPNLFFKAYYAKYYKEDTGKSIKGDFKITSIYSKKGSKYVELLKESLNEAKFSFSEDEVKDVAEIIAKAIAKLDNMKTAVHDMEYDKGRGAGFEISMGGDKYEGGSYTVKPNGDVVNSAIGNSFPNAVYAKIGDKDIKKVIKNIQTFEAVKEAKK
jgi:hypothetical protein|tara:strand:- start:494 stop:1678 length:1185 start_codon:yes stop_codon:yes gene_type:complete